MHDILCYHSVVMLLLGPTSTQACKREYILCEESNGFKLAVGALLLSAKKRDVVGRSSGHFSIIAVD